MNNRKFIYGITFKSGQCEIFQSDFEEDELLADLTSHKWVEIELLKKSKWTNEDEEIFRAKTVVVSIDNIESFCRLESEESNE